MAGRLVTPLMRFKSRLYPRDPGHAPETTPVSEAAALQTDLRRADIEPYGWVIISLAATGTRDPCSDNALHGNAFKLIECEVGSPREPIFGPEGQAAGGIG